MMPYVLDKLRKANQNAILCLNVTSHLFQLTKHISCILSICLLCDIWRRVLSDNVSLSHPIYLYFSGISYGDASGSVNIPKDAQFFFFCSSSSCNISSWRIHRIEKKDSKTFIWQRKYMLLENNPLLFHFVRSKPISYNIHWGKHCGHWTLIGQLHREGQSLLHSINAFGIDIFATSGDPYQGLWCRYHKGHI